MGSRGHICWGRATIHPLHLLYREHVLHLSGAASLRPEICFLYL